MPGRIEPRSTRAERSAQLARVFDVLVVGGGITGAGLALDLVARGLEVALIERDDWACATSSASSRLVHGGLRYLEQLDLSLVRESCLERGLLLENAAGLVRPERFVFPVHRGGPVGRAKLLAGLALYTAVSVPRLLGLPRVLGRPAVRAAIPGIRSEGLVGGGSYLDAATDDARLTLAVVTTASERGVIALSRAELTALEASSSSGVEARVQDRLDGEERTVRARAVVLAGGPFTDELRGRAGLGGAGWLRPTRGSHITVPRRRLPTDGAVIHNSVVDGRILFLIPWPRYTVVGTTDVDAPASEPIRATREEVRYLLDSANGLVPEAELTESDVVSTWAGLRPLLADDDSAPSARSREERVARDGPVYTIAGGKLTGYRAMAEKLGARIARDLGRGDAARKSPTRAIALTGARSAPVRRPEWSTLAGASPRIDRDPAGTAWSMRYGSLEAEVAAVCERTEEGRRAIDATTLLGEVDWAVAKEDCLTAVDFCFRRTDVGLEPEESVRAAVPLVIGRLASVLGWNAERRLSEETALLAALDARQAWRREGNATSLPRPAP